MPANGGANRAARAAKTRVFAPYGRRFKGLWVKSVRYCAKL
jgi:hypothetical protein